MEKKALCKKRNKRGEKDNKSVYCEHRQVKASDRMQLEHY